MLTDSCVVAVAGGELRPTFAGLLSLTSAKKGCETKVDLTNAVKFSTAGCPAPLFIEEGRQTTSKWKVFLLAKH